jgi:hypothetical protein
MISVGKKCHNTLNEALDEVDQTACGIRVCFLL